MESGSAAWRASCGRVDRSIGGARLRRAVTALRRQTTKQRWNGNIKARRKSGFDGVSPYRFWGNSISRCLGSTSTNSVWTPKRRRSRALRSFRLGNSGNTGPNAPITRGQKCPRSDGWRIREFDPVGREFSQAALETVVAVKKGFFVLKTPGRGIRVGGMARKVRVEYLGAIYLVMNRGNRREEIFREDPDPAR